MKYSLFSNFKNLCETKLKKLLSLSNLSAPICIEWFFNASKDEGIKLSCCYSPLNKLSENCQNLAYKINNNFEEYEISTNPIYINNTSSLAFHGGMAVGICVNVNEDNKKMLDPDFLDNASYAIYEAVCRYTELKQQLQNKVTYSRMCSGDTGSKVLWLNQKLFSKGFLEEKYMNSVFTKHTEKAVMAFQKHNSLIVDGVVERVTFEMLTEI